MGNVLNNFGAIFTLAFAVYSIINPIHISKMVSLTPYKQYGVAEIRSTYGGWIFGLAAYTLYIQNAEVFTCLGVGWIASGIMRTMAIQIDKTYNRRTLRFILVEWTIGIFLLI